MEAKGKIIRIGQTESFGDKGFKKRELILEVADNPQYPQIVGFEVTKDNCDKLDSLSPGQDLNVHFNLNGREWTNKEGIVKVFNTLSIWKWDVLRSQVAAEKTDDTDLPF